MWGIGRRGEGREKGREREEKKRGEGGGWK